MTDTGVNGDESRLSTCVRITGGPYSTPVPWSCHVRHVVIVTSGMVTLAYPILEGQDLLRAAPPGPLAAK